MRTVFKEIFKSVLTSKRIGVALCGSDLKIKFASKTFSGFADYAAGKLKGVELLEIFPPYKGDKQRIKTAFQNNVDNREKSYLAKCLHHCKTKDSWFEINVMVAESAQEGKRFVVLAHNVTKLARAKERLEVGAKQLEEAERMANIAHWEWDIENNKLHWSDQLYRIFGMEPQQITASYEFLIDSLHPDERELLQQKVQDALEKKTDYNIENRIVLESGQIRHIQTSGIVTFDHNQKPVKMLGVSSDITGRKEKEIKITKLNNDLQARLLERQVILESISDGIIFVNIEKDIVFINEIAKKILGMENNVNNFIGVKKELNFIKDCIDGCLSGRDFINKKINIINDDVRTQYLLNGKPIRDNNENIIGALGVMTDIREVKTMANVVSESTLITFDEIVGKSKEISDAIFKAQLVAETDYIASIYGESGTGKELFASAIHLASKRKGPFVPVNCAALPESLLESELFGYDKGAFTGAGAAGKKGLFEFAQNGTIFLDEIGEIPLGLQAKLLRVMQEGKIRRLGGSKEIAVNARIITATNRTLRTMVSKGEFREDLFYRINVFPIEIPPLRERKADIVELVNHFIFVIANNTHQKIKAFSPQAIDRLLEHSWPGNVRELKNVIERASILCKGEIIEDEDIVIDNAGLIYSIPKNYHLNFRSDINSLRELVDEFEKKVLSEKLSGAKSIRQLAKKLGLSHTATIKKLDKYNLKTLVGEQK